MSKPELKTGTSIAIERWGMKLTLEFLDVQEISDHARNEIEMSLRNAFGELGCELAGDGFIDWMPMEKGLTAKA